MVDIEIERFLSGCLGQWSSTKDFFRQRPSNSWTSSDIIHHQSSLDFLEFTKIRRIFMNRPIVYVGKTTAPAVCIAYMSKISKRSRRFFRTDLRHSTLLLIPVNRGVPFGVIEKFSVGATHRLPNGCIVHAFPKGARGGQEHRLDTDYWATGLLCYTPILRKHTVYVILC